MSLQRKLSSLGITDIRKIDTNIIEGIVKNVVNSVVEAFPYLKCDYEIFIEQLSKCKMYTAKIDSRLSRVNYFYENKSIYIDETLDLTKVYEPLIHEIIHFLQDYRNKKDNLHRFGLCTFQNFSVFGLGINEGAVQYIAAKSMQNDNNRIIRYGIELRTISPNYYPLLTNLIEQIVYLIGEEELVKGTINCNNEFKDYFLNTFEENAKYIVNMFDKMLDIKNNISLDTKDLEKEQGENRIVEGYLETESVIFSTYFEKMCNRLENQEEVDIYLEKANNFQKLIGINYEKRYSEKNFYEIEIEKLYRIYNKRLYDINKRKNKNALLIISSEMINKFMRKVFKLFSQKQ